MEPGRADVRECAGCHLVFASIFCATVLPSALHHLMAGRHLGVLEVLPAAGLIVLGVSRPVLDVGLFLLRPWGRTGVIALSVVSVAAWTLVAFDGLFAGAFPGVLLFLAPVGFHLFTLNVLARDSVRLLFGQGIKRVSF